MRLLEIPGGSYADCLPSGEYAVLVGDKVQTHLGTIDAPLGLPLYVRVTNVGGFKFAGQGSEGGTLVWDGIWTRRPEIAHGQSGCIWDRSGTLRIIEPAEGQTSQGFRYVAPDGSLVLGDTTYGAVHGINEWTDLSPAQDRSFLIGQGNQGGGVQCAINGVQRMVREGHCTFVRATIEGPLVALAFRMLHGAVLMWLTVEELKMFPPVETPVEPPPPVVNPPVEPPPPMPTIPEELSDQLALVTEVRERLFPGAGPLHDPEKAALWAKHLAWELKQKYPHLQIGLARAKDGSANHGGATSEVPEGFTTDIIALENGVHWDFQIDGHDGAALPRWALVPQFTEPGIDNYKPIAGRFVPAFDPGGTPELPKEPELPPVGNCDCLGKLAELSAKYAALLIRVEGAEAKATEALAEATKKRPLPPLRVKGSTSRSAWHSHDIDLPVVEGDV